MKKRIPALFSIILVTIFLTACASADFANTQSMSWAVDDNAEWIAPAATPMPEPAAAISEAELFMVAEEALEYGYSDGDAGRAYNTSQETAAAGGITPISAPVTTDLAEKIIYSVFAEIETKNFDETIENVHALMARYGAFIESSSISGVNYASQFHGWNDFRSAYFSLRVPQNQLNAMTASLADLGNVIHENSNAQNITSQFYDTQSRLNSLTIQEERLLDMLRRADEIPDLIAIEERLGEIRYQIEWLTTSLNTMQQQVDYSYLTLNIREVELFTEITETNRSYWQQIGEGFMSTLRGIGNFFLNLFMWLIVAAPVLIILAVIGVAILIIIRWRMRVYARKKKEQAAAAVNYSQQTPPDDRQQI